MGGGWLVSDPLCDTRISMDDECFNSFALAMSKVPGYDTRRVEVPVEPVLTPLTAEQAMDAVKEISVELWKKCPDADWSICAPAPGTSLLITVEDDTIFVEGTVECPSRVERYKALYADGAPPIWLFWHLNTNRFSISFGNAESVADMKAALVELYTI